MVDVEDWTQALLAPADVAIADGRPIADHELVSFLASGKLDETEHHLRPTPAAGIAGLRRGAHAGFPVSAAFARWLLGGDGLLRGDIDALLELSAAGDPGHRLAGVVLGSIALSNRERLEEAIDLLAAAARDHQGVPAALLRLHRGCRLAESGDHDQAAVALDGLRESIATLADPRARDISRVAGAVLLNLRPEAEELWEELHGNPPSAALEERTRLRVKGLTEAADLTLATLTAGTSPGIRASRWAPGLLGLLGAWLRAECWADYGAIRRSRAELAAHAMTQHLLPLPDAWTASGADRVDLDLARRSGDAPLTTRAYRTLWEGGPVGELHHAVAGLASTPWRADRELATLQAISAAGDLLPEDAADMVVERLVALLQDGARRHFAPEYEVSRALARVLPAAGATSHSRVARFLTEVPPDHRVVRPFAIVPEALDVERLSTTTQGQLEAWALRALDSTSNARLVGVEILLSLAWRADRASHVHDILLRRFNLEPSLRVALGLLLSSDAVEPVVVDFLLDRVEEPQPDDLDRGLDPAVLLAVAAARRPDVSSTLMTYLTRDDIDLPQKRWLLSQLAIGPREVAVSVLSAGAAAVLDERRKATRDLWPDEAHALHTEMLAARARAGRVQEAELLHEVSALTGGIAQDRGAAAHVLGSAAAVLPGAQLVALLIVLLADRDADVAVNAVAAVRRALPDVLPDAVQRGLWRMTGANGVARPLAAAGLLASRGSLDSVSRERLAQHPSALVRTVVSGAA